MSLNDKLEQIIWRMRKQPPDQFFFLTAMQGRQAVILHRAESYFQVSKKEGLMMRLPDCCKTE